MLACIDVDYRDSPTEKDGVAVAACVLFADWDQGESAAELVEVISPVEPYVPGQFYRREMPCILKVLAKAAEPPGLVIVDGYVWLGDETTPGLGAHLYEAMGRSTPVVGVAKSLFRGAAPVREVLRGTSERPLYVSAVGLELDDAARHVTDMHGDYRMPTVLRRVDRLCRDASAKEDSIDE